MFDVFGSLIYQYYIRWIVSKVGEDGEISGTWNFEKVLLRDLS